MLWISLASLEEFTNVWAALLLLLPLMLVVAFHSVSDIRCTGGGVPLQRNLDHFLLFPCRRNMKHEPATCCFAVIIVAAVDHIL